LVPRMGSVLTDNVVADIAGTGAGKIGTDVEDGFMVAEMGFEITGTELSGFKDDCGVDDNVDGVDRELLDDCCDWAKLSWLLINCSDDE